MLLIDRVYETLILNAKITKKIVSMINLYNANWFLNKTKFQFVFKYNFNSNIYIILTFENFNSIRSLPLKKKKRVNFQQTKGNKNK